MNESPQAKSQIMPDNEFVTQPVELAKQKFRQDVTRPIAWRKEQLWQLAEFVKKEESAINEALRSDLGRSEGETYLVERLPLLAEISHARKKLRKWAAPRRTGTPLSLKPATGFIYPEPLGVVLIISPWNYPMNLALGPLIGAMAAGNCAVIKPSELAPATSSLLAERLGNYIDPKCFLVVEGAVPETTALLKQRFDHICYTGGGRVGRIVMKAAAEHLTPTTLELGGKSPAIVHQSANIPLSAKRIAWGKFLNSGQTCVAPDYVLATEACHDQLIDELKSAVVNLFGSQPQQHPDYSRMINPDHFDRVSSLIDADKVVHGGQTDRVDKFIAPTLMSGVSENDPVMQEEIFGPVLPIVKVQDIDKAIDFVNAREKPLALYLFHRDKTIEHDVLALTPAGGVTVNHTILHLANGKMPFGGVGESGMRAYHGQWGFDNFSHLKPVLRKATWLDPGFTYPPFTAWKRWILSWFE